MPTRPPQRARIEDDPRHDLEEEDFERFEEDEERHKLSSRLGGFSN
jgi:hypothetical protein